MLEIVILAVVQGIAEFLPISSSGHLVILGELLGKLGDSPTLEIILHAGTLGSILVVFWRRIVRLLTTDKRVIPLLVVGTIPAAVVGLTIRKYFEQILHNPVLVGAMLLLTGAMLIVLGRLKARECEYRSMSWLARIVGWLFSSIRHFAGRQPQWINDSRWSADGTQERRLRHVLFFAGNSGDSRRHRFDPQRPVRGLFGRDSNRLLHA